MSVLFHNSRKIKDCLTDNDFIESRSSKKDSKIICAERKTYCKDEHPISPFISNTHQSNDLSCFDDKVIDSKIIDKDLNNKSDDHKMSEPPNELLCNDDVYSNNVDDVIKDFVYGDNEIPNAKTFIDVDKERNEMLRQKRVIQKNYSDIFCLSDTNTNESVLGKSFLDKTAVCNRNIHQVHQEILPTAHWTVQSCHTPQSNDFSSAKERYDRDFLINDNITEVASTVAKPKIECNILKSSVEPMTAGITSHTHLNTNNSQKNAHSVIIALLRLANIPEYINEYDILNVLKRCHCYVIKTWFPINLISGVHKTVGSVMIRQSFPYLESKNNNGIPPFQKSMEDLLSENSELAPFDHFQKWMIEKNISFTLQDWSLEL